MPWVRSPPFRERDRFGQVSAIAIWPVSGRCQCDVIDVRRRLARRCFQFRWYVKGSAWRNVARHMERTWKIAAYPLRANNQHRFVCKVGRRSSTFSVPRVQKDNEKHTRSRETVPLDRNSSCWHEDRQRFCDVVSVPRREEWSCYPPRYVFRPGKGDTSLEDRIEGLQALVLT